MVSRGRAKERGSFTAEGLREEGRYELSEGHPIYCEPAGARHANTNLVGGLPLATDPDVSEAGVDAGFAVDGDTVRAPDIAVGNVPLRPGWITGAPPLAVEYADTGTDEADLQKKIGELFSAGTKIFWVVRLIGPRRVEVYEPGKPVRTEGPGTELRAPGILRNAIPVEALFDRKAAFQVTLRNLLQQAGYADLEAVLDEGRGQGREEGREQGREEGREQGQRQALTAAIEALCDVLGIALDGERRRELGALEVSDLAAKVERLRRQRSW